MTAFEEHEEKLAMAKKLKACVVCDKASDAAEDVIPHCALCGTCRDDWKRSGEKRRVDGGSGVSVAFADYVRRRRAEVRTALLARKGATT